MAELTELRFRLGKRPTDSRTHAPSTNYALCIVCQERTPESLQNLTEAGYDEFLCVVTN